ncbi:hypothetical protein CHS0354_025008 [Potamilus streckersoni]|uniref:Eukaryotic translation initiation factor 2A n=1 Tax=Potamilus streckersoni TaxID=2493646 RepID=A0AAE0SS57_9BIVA|nr:hypothetical protein CHS0354_025008 [Potamilus streckersoni]
MAIPFTLRGTDGLWMTNGPPALGTQPDFKRDTSKTCKVFAYSKDGLLFAWCNGEFVNIVNTQTFKLVHQLNLPRTSCMEFSPQGNLLMTWEPYQVDTDAKHGIPNLGFWDVKTGQCVKTLIQKKQTSWAPQWTADEHLSSRNVNNEIHFFEDHNFDVIKEKLHLQKISTFALSPAGPPYMVAGYVPGSKGQPSFVRLFKYPNLSTPIANKSFFKCDKVEMAWNKAGTGVLILTSTETSNESYYGDQGLYFIASNGESMKVTLGKNGPIYHLQWSPKSNEFCVVYGFMPAKATLYDMKAEPIFDFGTGPRNYCYYNCQGSIVCLAGFGNLRGNMEFWDVKQKQLIVQTNAPDTTNFEWCPDGQHILTATTAPRLRVANGYRIWHYTGALLEQVNLEEKKELWEVKWQNQPEETIKDFQIKYKPVEGVPSLPQPETKVAAYRPPGAGGRPASVKLHDYEAPSVVNETAKANKPLTKNQKKREARKAKASQEVSTENHDQSTLMDFPSIGNAETDKKIRNIRKKLQQIEKIKEQQQAGKQLEKNQLEKIQGEAALMKELEDLVLS